MGKNYRKTKNGRYEAYTSDHGKYVYLGTYNNENDAIKAVKRYKYKRLEVALQKAKHKIKDGIVYEDKYLVFSNGDVFNFNGKKMSPTIDKNGYLHGLLNGKNRLYHRVIAECFIPNPSNKPNVNHINGIKTDNRVENLEWCTYSENTLHAYQTGLEQKRIGVNNHNSKLTDDLIRYIRQSKKSNYMLAKELNVDPSTIRDARNKKTWRHVI